MSKFTIRFTNPQFFKDVADFFVFLKKYVRSRGYGWFSRFEIGKSVVVDLLYKQRGKYSRPFLHFGTVGLVFAVVTFGPLLFSKTEDEGQAGSSQGIIAASAYGTGFSTLQAEEVRQYRGGEIIIHSVQDGETISSIADRYNLQVATVLWENDLTEKSKLKPGQEIKILPVDGIRHKVSRGQTIFSIAKKYGLDSSQAQVIVDYPFNEFLNDETFELTTGQFLMVPDGIIADSPIARPIAPSQLTPNAGSVTATGNFVWPSSGRLTQTYRFYHKAIDIANKGGGAVLAADSGIVTGAGWLDGYGYGNRVIIDHGNGFTTLYGHLSAAQVRTGQSVNRGDVIGQMGSSGRSTGVHLHFEVRLGGVAQNPLNFLR